MTILLPSFSPMYIEHADAAVAPPCLDAAAAPPPCLDAAAAASHCLCCCYSDSRLSWTVRSADECEASSAEHHLAIRHDLYSMLPQFIRESNSSRSPRKMSSLDDSHPVRSHLQHCQSQFDDHER